MQKTFGELRKGHKNDPNFDKKKFLFYVVSKICKSLLSFSFLRTVPRYTHKTFLSMRLIFATILY